MQAIEVVNGGNEKALGGFEGILSGVPFWEAQLNQGRRITAIGGSDNNAVSRRKMPVALGKLTHSAKLSGEVHVLKAARNSP